MHGSHGVLGSTILSFIERLSSLWRLKCTSMIEKRPQSESRFFVSFSSECPLFGGSSIGAIKPCLRLGQFRCRIN